MMPRMTGLEMLHALKADDSDLAFVPIIFITARAGEEQRIDGLQSGADGQSPRTLWTASGARLLILASSFQTTCRNPSRPRSSWPARISR